MFKLFNSDLSRNGPSLHYNILRPLFLSCFIFFLIWKTITTSTLALLVMRSLNNLEKGRNEGKINEVFSLGANLRGCQKLGN